VAVQALITDLGGRRLSFNAGDGFLMSAVMVPSSRKPARAVVVLMDPEESFEAYDSLAVGLARAGFSVAMVEARGSGYSVSPLCPLPSTWRGREDELRDRVAADALDALRAMAKAMPVDITRYVVIGALGSSASAAKAASLDRRARPVVLLSPSPAPVERGVMRAWLSATAVPVFFEVPIMDHENLPVVEALYEGLDPRASRIAESERIGSSATVFRYDTSALPRLLTWLDESSASKPVSKSKKKR